MTSSAIILCHVGPQVPDYLNDCIAQIRKYTAMRVIVVADNYTSAIDRVDIVPTNTFDNDEVVKQMRDLPFKINEPNPLWRTAALRFGYVAAAACLFDVEDIFHFDNDVLIYCDPLNLVKPLREGRDIAITPCNDELLICGFMYVRSMYTMSALASRLAEKMETVDDNEMRLLRLIADDCPNSFDMLPMLPTDPAAKRFGCVFDCASWGQWVGGTHQEPGVAWAGDHHIVGRELLAGNVGLEWEPRHPHGRLRPVALDLVTTASYPIANLHIHSKELDKYAS